MIIGRDRRKVIENIRQAFEENRLNDKVEMDDPKLTPDEQQKIIDKYLELRKKPQYFMRNIMARALVDTATKVINKNTKVVGINKIRGIRKGAIVTSNHFNPLENTAIKKAVGRTGRKRLYIVSQVTNLAMTGWIGFIMKYADIIPVCGEYIAYMMDEFNTVLRRTVRRGKWILIYPEEEMWFNYRRPRPPKRGAYYYAAKFQIPIISFFVEIRDLSKKDTDEFYKVQYIVHTLDPIYPDNKLSVRENSIRMMKKDYEQKVKAYEEAYGKKIDDRFSYDDIAGYIHE